MSRCPASCRTESIHPCACFVLGVNWCQPRLQQPRSLQRSYRRRGTCSAQRKPGASCFVSTPNSFWPNPMPKQKGTYRPTALARLRRSPHRNGILGTRRRGPLCPTGLEHELAENECGPGGPGPLQISSAQEWYSSYSATRALGPTGSEHKLAENECGPSGPGPPGRDTHMNGILGTRATVHRARQTRDVDSVNLPQPCTARKYTGRRIASRSTAELEQGRNSTYIQIIGSACRLHLHRQWPCSTRRSPGSRRPCSRRHSRDTGRRRRGTRPSCSRRRKTCKGRRGTGTDSRSIDTGRRTPGSISPGSSRIPRRPWGSCHSPSSAPSSWRCATVPRLLLGRCRCRRADRCNWRPEQPRPLGRRGRPDRLCPRRDGRPSTRAAAPCSPLLFWTCSCLQWVRPAESPCVTQEWTKSTRKQPGHWRIRPAGA